MADPAPRVDVAFEAIRRRGNGWLVTWRVRNAGAAPLTILAAWHPHGRFHSTRLRRSLRIGPRASASLELPARITAAPRETVENCFVIFRAARGRGRWRILARSTLRMDDAGVPGLTVEQVDVHPVEA